MFYPQTYDNERGEGKMGMLVWILLGGIGGIIASVITLAEGEDEIVGNILLGMLGGLLSGLLLSVFRDFGASTLQPQYLIISLIGATVLIYMGRVIRRT